MPIGSTSWQSILCYPTWDYRAMQLACFFTALFWLRLYARREIHEYQRRRLTNEIKEQEEEACCMGGPLKRPLLKPVTSGPSGSTASVLFGDHGSKSPSAGEQEPGTPKSVTQRCLRRTSYCIMNLLRRLSALTYDIVKRTTLQILQWWVIMIAVLVLLLADVFYEVTTEQGISFTLKPDFRGSHLNVPADFAAIPHWLVIFSIYSFVALLVVYVFSLLSIVLQVFTHTSLQVLRCNMLVAGSAMVTLPRDVAIQVLLLPMVYSILAAKNVSIMWSNMRGHFPDPLNCFNRTDSDKTNLLMESFESNFALADMYEAWALYCFGSMVAKVLQPDLRKKIRLDVVKAFESLLLIDVSVFVLVCAVGADYLIILTWCKWRLGWDLCEDFPAICSFRPYLVGANWCSSSIAIYNLLTIEHKFGRLETMMQFGPNLKFWSIKIMVLVAFWMGLVSVLVRDLWHLTDHQSQLLDATFRIYVMAMVSIINLKAWWPWSEWYWNVDDEEVYRLTSRISFLEGSQPLTEVGVKHVPPGTVSLVQQLFGLAEEEAKSWPHVAKVIKELDDASLSRAMHYGSQIGWAVKEDKIGKKGARQRKIMMDLCVQERREGLMEHLQGFYPEV